MLALTGKKITSRLDHVLKLVKHDYMAFVGISVINLCNKANLRTLIVAQIKRLTIFYLCYFDVCVPY